MGVPLPGLAFTPAMRMVDRIHGHPTDMGPATLPTRASCFAHHYICMVKVADLSDCRLTGP